MTNLYQAPTSDLLGEVVERPKKRWKVFFWLILVLEMLSIFGMLSEDAVDVKHLILEVLMYSFVLLGLFGFAYHKRIFVAGFWKLVLPVVMSYDAYSFATVEGLELQEVDSIMVVLVIMVILILPLLLFQYYALFRYGFKSAFIWGDRQRPES